MPKKRRANEIEGAVAESAPVADESRRRKKNKSERKHVGQLESSKSRLVKCETGSRSGTNEIEQIDHETESGPIDDLTSEILSKTSVLAESYNDLDYTRLLDFSKKLLALISPGPKNKRHSTNENNKTRTTHEAPSKDEEDSVGIIPATKFESIEIDLAAMRQEQRRYEQQQQVIIKTLQSETAILRQDIDMTIVQREQQRSWNKNALKEQAELFQKEISALRKQLKGQEEQTDEIRQLRAELAELKAGASGQPERPMKQSGTAQLSNNKVVRDQKEKSKSTASPPVMTSVQADAVELIKRSIERRQKSWEHFLSQKGNYMYASNLENGLKDILRDIRHFNIHNPHLGSMAFYLVMVSTELWHCTVSGETNEEQDFHSIPLKLAVWNQVDEFAALILRGLGWQYATAEQELEMLQRRRSALKRRIQPRLPDLSLDSWFSQTVAGLEKCVRRLEHG